MTTQRITLERVAIIDKGTYGYNTLEVSLSYDKGGPNYFTGEQSSRGYTLSVVPHKVDGMSRSSMAFSGTKKFLKDAQRFSLKHMMALAEELRAGKVQYLEVDVVKYLKDHVMEKNAFTFPA